LNRCFVARLCVVFTAIWYQYPNQWNVAHFSGSLCHGVHKEEAHSYQWAQKSRSKKTVVGMSSSCRCQRRSNRYERKRYLHSNE
jgi:hypothetical protein